jgi:uncharacterized protein YbjT (DUF2867 family)
MSKDRSVTVFGGTGFLGRRIVRHLRDRGFAAHVASRHPERARAAFGTELGLHPVRADVHDDASVADAIAGAYGVVNAVSLYVEHGVETFHAVHVEAAARLARLARERGVERLLHVSGIGADPRSRSLYIRSRGEGEAAVGAAFPEAIILRPAVMFGPDDVFLTTILNLLRRLPAYPLFGRGRTRLQPAYVDDVAEAAARALERAEAPGMTFECGGPRVYSYAELLRSIAREAGLRPVLVPMPFAAWHILGFAAEFLPRPPLTRNQVELMEIDNVASPGAPGLRELSVAPRTVEEITREIVGAP